MAHFLSHRHPLNKRIMAVNLWPPQRRARVLVDPLLAEGSV